MSAQPQLTSLRTRRGSIRRVVAEALKRPVMLSSVITVGPEFQVNTFTTNPKYNAAAAVR